MEPKKILSASLVDIIFDDRNKDYGAYDLRVTYPQRIKKSILITFAVVGSVFGAAALAGSISKERDSKITYDVVELSEIPQEEIKPEEIKPLPKPVEPQVRTQAYTEPRIVPEDMVTEPPPTQDDLTGAKIDVKTTDGVEDVGIQSTPLDVDNKRIIEEKKPTDEVWAGPVEIDAKFEGNWARFLTRNLNGDVPVNNGAPAGVYKVIIQFVVDLEGNVSDIKPLTSHGYGMEEEAIRVLKKATGWAPAIQNGNKVKAYRRQPITFEVTAE